MCVISKCVGHVSASSILSQKVWKWAIFFAQYLKFISFISGAVGLAVGHPMDTVKVGTTFQITNATFNMYYYNLFLQ